MSKLKADIDGYSIMGCAIFVLIAIYGTSLATLAFGAGLIVGWRLSFASIDIINE